MVAYIYVKERFFLVLLEMVVYTSEREMILTREGDGAFIDQAPSLQKEGRSTVDFPTHDTIGFRNTFIFRTTVSIGVIIKSNPSPLMEPLLTVDDGKFLW